MITKTGDAFKESKSLISGTDKATVVNNIYWLSLTIS